VPIGIPLWGEGGDHGDLLRKEAVPLGMPISMPIGIFLESLLREGVSAHRNILREGWKGGGGIGISLESKGCPLDL